MKLLELFSGTGSVGRVAKEKGFEVISLDLKNADINLDILYLNGIIKCILVDILILCFLVVGGKIYITQATPRTS